MKFNLALLFFLLSLKQLQGQDLKLKIYGNHNTTERIKNEFFPSGINLEGFDPKNGYQIGVQYDHFVYKSFLAQAEIGFLNKGHNANNPSTGEKLYSVDYNYIYFKPSIGYYWKGFSLSGGLFFNFLSKQVGVTQGTISNTDIAYSFELAYQFKRFGIQTSFNKSIRPMQTTSVSFANITYEHYHRWFSVGLCAISEER
jgi:hypothetical protein